MVLQPGVLSPCSAPGPAAPVVWGSSPELALGWREGARRLPDMDRLLSLGSCLLGLLPYIGVVEGGTQEYASALSSRGPGLCSLGLGDAPSQASQQLPSAAPGHCLYPPRVSRAPFPLLRAARPGSEPGNRPTATASSVSGCGWNCAWRSAARLAQMRGSGSRLTTPRPPTAMRRVSEGVSSPAWQPQDAAL